MRRWGLYFGPSLFAMSVHGSSSSSVAVNGVTQSANASTSIFTYGAAFDVGAQTSSSFKVSGVLPRFLFTIGYSF